ncbi:gamma-interferon-inducible lysosomal thiol reductase [Protopterus annectens]|uniref:gamma-interferon-inducible lysosomal thiol reductase n=1 Tax=Protopterus annectens TaxID=7888 RepID=UPI001CFA121F|nr:gamma-interferon-inducible lysosomal thiol reductase [Protopterus annectens]
MKIALTLLVVFFWAWCPSDAKHVPCPFPEELWCSSREIATACQASCRNIPEKKSNAVQISLYYESLCPGCREFFVSQLYPTWLTLGDVINMTLVPYGNAEERNTSSGKWEFTCQHGESECLGNMIETCIMYYLKDASAYANVIYCMESSVDVLKSAPLCLQIYSKDVTWDKVQSCVNGDLGNQLMHQNALMTDALSPQHEYVPWILVNGKHTDDLQKQAQSALFNLVCKLYTGEKPDPCQAV